MRTSLIIGNGARRGRAELGFVTGAELKVDGGISAL
jgi:hypothetical protein